MSAALSILKAVHQTPRLSRAQLTRSTSLGASTVSLHVKQLLDSGVLREIGTRQNPLGRPSILLEINPEFAYVVGAYHDQRSLTGVIASFSGDIVARSVKHLDDTTPDAFVKAAAALVAALVEDSGVPARRVAGVGIAMSGLIDGESGTCINSTVLGWRDVPLASLLADRIRYPVVLENDANAMAVASHYFGLARGHASHCIVALGEGLGGGIYLGGELVRGTMGVVAEVGHLTVDPAGPLCACGKRGCVEALASARALRQVAQEHGWPVATLAGVRVLGVAGDVVAADAHARATNALGLAISHVVNLLCPEQIVIIDKGVGLDAASEHAISRAVEECTMPMIPAVPTIAFETATDDAWALGAASLSMHALLEGRWSTVEDLMMTT